MLAGDARDTIANIALEELGSRTFQALYTHISSFRKLLTSNALKLSTPQALHAHISSSLHVLTSQALYTRLALQKAACQRRARVPLARCVSSEALEAQ